MVKHDPFWEPRQGYDTLLRVYTDCGSLNANTVGIAPRTCEGALRILYEIATGEPFPHKYFYPWHDPLGLVRKIGILRFYTPQTQAWLGRAQGWALSDVEYGKKPFEDYTSPKSRNRAGEVVNGTGQFIEETAAFQTNAEVLAIIRANKPT